MGFGIFWCSVRRNDVKREKYWTGVDRSERLFTVTDRLTERIQVRR